MSNFDDLLDEVNNICKPKDIWFKSSIFEHRLDTNEITYMFEFRKDGKKLMYRITQEKIDNNPLNVIMTDVNYNLKQYIFDRFYMLSEDVENICNSNNLTCETADDIYNDGIKFKFRRFDGKSMEYKISRLDLERASTYDVIIHMLLEEIEKFLAEK